MVTSLVQPLEAEAAAAYPAMPLALAQLPEPQRRPQALAQQVPVWLPQPERRFCFSRRRRWSGSGFRSSFLLFSHGLAMPFHHLEKASAWARCINIC
ncbi:MAG: hypothetical protein HZT40_11560 [Candidatus Thiothrix singaporensis]|uniref:Uncharacterized protein n=1 Tax=Candidatus Thiothrix singaporensis TaxID=2799669 RepID=A0A7L6ASR2_9GAMM|nr:MAG: hypothetical protein HZT40_11560 [Candidatus Thiothrix singaporensis]